MSESQETTSSVPAESARTANRRALDNAGVETILDKIRAGDTQTEIAAALGVSRQALIRYLAENVDADKYTRARIESAESWADRGWECLQTAREGDSAAVNLARYMEQHCMRRAGIVNARYSEKQSVELSGPNGGAIQTQSQVLVYVPHNSRDDAGQTHDLPRQDYASSASD